MHHFKSNGQPYPKNRTLFLKESSVKLSVFDVVVDSNGWQDRFDITYIINFLFFHPTLLKKFIYYDIIYILNLYVKHQGGNTMKRLLSIILSITMLSSLSVSVFANKTSKKTETPATSVACSDWAKESIEKAKELNIVDYDSNYNYPGTITREQFCELVFNLICAVNDGFVTEDTEVKFTDTDNHKILALNRAGIIYGKSDTEFVPNDFLTREEAATILVRMINREMPMAATEVWFEFDDIGEVSEWASSSVQTMCNLGFMVGIGENKFAPKNTYTTEQAIVTIMRIYEATRKTYTYETPLGTIQTEENYNSHINFAIQCDAIVHVIQDNTRFDETHHIIGTSVKSLTNQTSAMLICFDDFARIFGGEWSLNDGVFEFKYDTERKIELAKSDGSSDGTDGEWPNKTDSVNVINFYPDMNTINVNGESVTIKAQNGGRVYDSCITMYDGTLYIPVQMVAELLNFDIASLQVILK